MAPYRAGIFLVADQLSASQQGLEFNQLSYYLRTSPENRGYSRRGSAALTTQHPSIR
jgi:hypothetical protein